MRRQSLNVFRMRLMGAKVVGVSSGTRTLKDATTEAIRDWVTNVNDTYYIIGSVVGPAPYPRMVRDFQSVIGREARAQMLERAGGCRRRVVACVGGGSNAMGAFHAFIDDRRRRARSASKPRVKDSTPSHHSASLSRGTSGRAARLVELSPAGRARPGASRAFDFGGPRLSGRRTGALVSQGQRTRDVRRGHGSRGAGRFPALEPTGRNHSGAGNGARCELDRFSERALDANDEPILLCVSGRGDKDVAQVSEMNILGT